VSSDHPSGDPSESPTIEKREKGIRFKDNWYDDCEATLVIKCQCGHVTFAHGTREEAFAIKIAYCAKCGRGQRIDHGSMPVIEFKEAA